MYITCAMCWVLTVSKWTKYNRGVERGKEEMVGEKRERTKERETWGDCLFILFSPLTVNYTKIVKKKIISHFISQNNIH